MFKRSLLLWVFVALVVALLSVPMIAWLTRSRGMGQMAVAPQPMMFRGAATVTNESAGSVAQTMPYRAPVQDKLVEVSGDAYDMAMPPIEPDSFTPAQERSIVRVSNLGLVVTDVRKTVDDITALVTAEKGFVTASSISESIPAENALLASMTLRVPNEKLDVILDSLRQMAERVTVDQLSATDKTTQRIDLEARLSNLRATETQLLSIMAKATTVEDTLTVQKELQNTRDSIERLQAQLDYLKGDASMSTIQVNLSTKADIGPVVSDNEPSIREELRATLVETVRLYRRLLLGVLQLGIVLAPVLLVLGLIAAWIRSKRPHAKK